MATASRTTPTTTRRKPAATKAAEPKAPTFHFSIKQAEAEAEQVRKSRTEAPFTVEGKNGEVITFRHPEDVGWQESAALSMRDPYLAVQSMLDDENYDVFIAQGDFGNGVLRDLVEKWMTYHGVIPAGN
jgi:hypothetical protein